MRPKLMALAAFALVATMSACDPDASGDGDGVEPPAAANDTTVRTAAGSLTTLVANTPSTIVIGQNRLLLRAVDEQGTPVGGPDQERRLRLSGAGDDAVVEARWVWNAEPFSGFYTAMVDFDEPGLWEVQLEAEGETIAATFVDVLVDSVVPMVGAEVPASDTPTIGELPIDRLTTDPVPLASLYELSVADAIASGQPSVIAFATPQFCRTDTCGPVLDEIKDLEARRSGVDFVHVEIYDIEIVRAEQDLVPVPSVVEWGLPSEPWVFVVDADGLVVASFEGFVTADEIDRALG